MRYDWKANLSHISLINTENFLTIYVTHSLTWRQYLRIFWDILLNLILKLLIENLSLFERIFCNSNLNLLASSTDRCRTPRFHRLIDLMIFRDTSLKVLTCSLNLTRHNLGSILWDRRPILSMILNTTSCYNVSLLLSISKWTLGKLTGSIQILNHCTT